MKHEQIMVIDNKKEAARKKSLGELGELFAIKALVDKEFDRIRNVNDNKMNEAFADIVCEKDGRRYFLPRRVSSGSSREQSENQRRDSPVDDR